MANRLETIAEKLEKRAATLDSHLTKASHPSVLAAVNRTSASLRTCGRYAAELLPASLAYSERVVKRSEKASQGRQTGEKIGLLLSANAFQSLVDAVELIANERDKEAFKALGKQTLEFGLKVAATLSGFELVKLAKEMIEAGLDVVRLGQSTKLRKNQVAVASNFLSWLDAITIICLGWCFRAQRQLLAMEGKGQTSDDEILAMVEKRIVDLATRSGALPTEPRRR
jgi:hypothetical protein